ncbi:hypothetical protein ONS96_010511 [Cadophora gregata f. sp. sojae]|nr:hypothetical protein ONS96_010511 [Cadophora gregata f. sp. sojae]
MLSSVRVASRQAVSRGIASKSSVAVASRQASTWANVPQGPPDVSTRLDIQPPED